MNGIGEIGTMLTQKQDEANFKVKTPLQAMMAQRDGEVVTSRRLVHARDDPTVCTVGSWFGDNVQGLKTGWRETV